MRLKKSETSDNKYLPDFQNYNSTGTNPELQKSPSKKAAREKELSYARGKELSYSEEDSSRIGNTPWSFCGKYKPMTTNAEIICCLDEIEISDSYFKGVHAFALEIFIQ